MFKKIDSIEEEVKAYDKHPDKIPYEPPFVKAIETYLQGSETLKGIGWTEQSISFYDGSQAYRERSRRDRNFREEEKLRIAKTKEEQKMLEQRAKLSKKLQAEREKESILDTLVEHVLHLDAQMNIIWANPLLRPSWHR